MSPRTRARLELLAAALLFSTGGAAIKRCSFDAWEVACLRSAIAFVALMALAPAARRGWTPGAALAALAYAATVLLFVLANKLTTSANTIFLQSTAPLYLLGLAPWLLGERVAGRDLGLTVALALGLACVVLGGEVGSSTAPDPTRGNWLAALSGMSWAFTLVGLRMLARGGGTGRTGRAEPAVAIGNLAAALVALVFALPIAGGALDWAVVGYLGVFQIGLAYVFVTRAMGQVSALEAALLLLVEPALNPLWSYLVHGERPGTWAIAGGALIVGATTAKSWLDARSARAA